MDDVFGKACVSLVTCVTRVRARTILPQKCRIPPLRPTPLPVKKCPKPDIQLSLPDDDSLEEDKRATTNVQNRFALFFLLSFLLFCSP